MLWRAYSDAVNVALLARWFPESPVNLLLKTDLFDEALSEGLYPCLASRAKSVLGMDISTSVIQAAGSRHTDLRAIAADVRCLPFADNKFDIIVSNSTLDHSGIASVTVLLFVCGKLWSTAATRGRGVGE